MFTSSWSRGRGVTVRLGHEGRQVDHVFVEDHSVLLGTGSNFEAFVVRLPREEIEVRYGHVAAFPDFHRVAGFAQDVVSHDPVVELLGGEGGNEDISLAVVQRIAVSVGVDDFQFLDF